VTLGEVPQNIGTGRCKMAWFSWREAEGKLQFLGKTLPLISRPAELTNYGCKKTV